MNIKKIQETSGARVAISKESLSVTITGEPEQIAKAKDLLAEYVEHGGPKPDTTITMELTKPHKILVLGNKGEKIRQLQDTSGAKFDFDNFTLKISGDHENVAKARRAVDALIQAHSIEVSY